MRPFLWCRPDGLFSNLTRFYFFRRECFFFLEFRSVLDDIDVVSVIFFLLSRIYTSAFAAFSAVLGFFDCVLMFSFMV